MASGVTETKEYTSAGLVVALDRDYSQSDLDRIMDAVKMIKGVLDVTAEKVSITDYIARRRVELKIRKSIMAVLNSEPGVE